MCNHFETDQLALHWAIDAVPGTNPPKILQEIRRHMWPKYQAPVIIEEDGRREGCFLRWGVWPFYARAKAQYITNAREEMSASMYISNCGQPDSWYGRPAVGRASKILLR